MGPVVWWWRWWLGMDPNRDREMAEVQEFLDAQAEAADAPASANDTGDDELERLRSRVRTLDGAERDVQQLRAQVNELGKVRKEAEKLRAEVTELKRNSAEADRLRAELDQAHAETAELRAQLAEWDSAQSEPPATQPEPAEAKPEPPTAQPEPAEAKPEPPATQPEPSAAQPDLEEAKRILGSSISVDDLTVIEGVGPKIAGLLADAGVDSWRGLADADVDRLREVLADAGPRYRLHDPAPWPEQAALLADGRWQEFKDRRRA